MKCDNCWKENTAFCSECEPETLTQEIFNKTFPNMLRKQYAKCKEQLSDVAIVQLCTLAEDYAEKPYHEWRHFCHGDFAKYLEFLLNKKIKGEKK